MEQIEVQHYKFDWTHNKLFKDNIKFVDKTIFEV